MMKILHPKTRSKYLNLSGANLFFQGPMKQSEFCSDLFLAFPVSANNGQTSGTCLLTPLQNVVDFFRDHDCRSQH